MILVGSDQVLVKMLILVLILVLVLVLVVVLVVILDQGLYDVVLGVYVLVGVMDGFDRLELIEVVGHVLVDMCS